MTQARPLTVGNKWPTLNLPDGSLGYVSHLGLPEGMIGLSGSIFFSWEIPASNRSERWDGLSVLFRILSSALGSQPWRDRVPGYRHQ